MVAMPASPLTLRQHMRHQRVGVAVAHAVLGLEPGDVFHVFGGWAGSDLGFPFGDWAAVFRLDRGEVGGGAFDFWGFWQGWLHVMVN